MSILSYGAAAAGAAVLGGGLAWGNLSVTTTEFPLRSPAAPEAFRGFRIAHISDWHNAAFTERLALAVQEAKPDIICITGDMIDARRTNIPRALDTAKALTAIAPCYYVTGNHEERIPSYPRFEEGLRALGVFVLHNEAVTLGRGGDALTILGADDPGRRAEFPDTLRQLREQAEGFSLLLCHRPEKFPLYCEVGFDLVLTGHAHGGQVRIPGIGGVIAPHQGFFPKYDGGLYTDGTTNMVLSRGLGNSLCPLRVNNRPELVVVELM